MAKQIVLQDKDGGQLHPITRAESVYINDTTTLDEAMETGKVDVNNTDSLMIMGSSLTECWYNPKGASWIERLNDMVDIPIINNGKSGANLDGNISQLVSNATIRNSSVKPNKVHPTYILWHVAANGGLTGSSAIPLLNAAKEITERLGAKMLMGSEEDYKGGVKTYERLYSAYCYENKIPFYPIGSLWGKLFPASSIPYTGWQYLYHGGYRNNSPYMMYKDFIDALPISRAVKFYKVRPAYASGSPTAANLVYDTPLQRLRYFTAASSGAVCTYDTSRIDNMDDAQYAVAEGANTGDCVGNVANMIGGLAVNFNKVGLIEFILDRVNITKASFSVKCSVQPTAVYIAKVSNSSTTYDGTPRTSWQELTTTYADGAVSASIEAEDIQLYDKVRILVMCSGAFTLQQPSLEGYDGEQKITVQKPVQRRRFGTELLSNTAAAASGVWTMVDATVGEFPSDIQWYTAYNNIKKHVEIPNNSAYIRKVINVDSTQVHKVAIRIVAMSFMKIQTTRLSAGTYVEGSNILYSNYDYDYGTLALRVNQYHYQTRLIGQGWGEYYFEVPVFDGDTSLTIDILRANWTNADYLNSDNPLFIHDVSVQVID